MYRIYKGQPFTIASAQTRRGKWDLRIGIMGEKNPMQISVKGKFATFQEAQQYGVRWVKQWVDEGHPDLARETKACNILAGLPSKLLSIVSSRILHYAAKGRFCLRVRHPAQRVPNRALHR